jgi:hypothetical protein
LCEKSGGKARKNRPFVGCATVTGLDGDLLARFGTNVRRSALAHPTDKDIAKKINDECSHGDWESAHGDADKIIVELLRQLGYTETADAWDKVGKWYS